MHDKTHGNDLDARLRAVEAARNGAGEKPDAAASGLGGGMELIGSVAVCGVVGALGDRAVGTAPWIMIAMILVGFVIGLYTLWLGMNKPGKN